MTEYLYPPKYDAIYKGKLSDDPTTFEYPFVENYLGHKGCGTGSVDWEERVNMERMRSYRLERAKAELVKANVGAILSLNEWNMRYITGTWTPTWTSSSSGLRYALMAANAKAPIVYEQGEIGYHTRNMCPWLDKVKVAITGAGWIGALMGPKASLLQREKLVKQIIGDLKDYGVDKEVLALDTPDPALVEAFQNAGIKVRTDGGLLMLQARKIKGPDEVECLRIASAIAEAQFEALRAKLRPGVRECDLMAAMHQACYEHNGIVFTGNFVTSGPFSWPNPRVDTGDRMIRPGEVVFADTANSSYMGYHTCYYRSFSCGKAPQKIKDNYARALDWLRESMSVIKAGASTADIAAKWPPCETIWGDILVKHEDQTAGSNWAHGIGLTLYEYPVIWRETSLKDPLILEENMTFAIETQHGTLGYGCARMEEMVRVTKDGYELLSQWPIDEITEVPI